MNALIVPILVLAACHGLLASSNGQYYPRNNRMLELVNKARAAAKQPPLCSSDRLMRSSLEQSKYQAQIENITHDGPVPLQKRFTNQGFEAWAVAENVGETPDIDVGEVMEAWLKSPLHYSNIIGNYTHFGSAAAPGNSGKYYWTQHFAKAMNSTESCMDGATNANNASAKGEDEELPPVNNAGAAQPRMSFKNASNKAEMMEAPPDNGVRIQANPCAIPHHKPPQRYGAHPHYHHRENPAEQSAESTSDDDKSVSTTTTKEDQATANPPSQSSNPTSMDSKGGDNPMAAAPRGAQSTATPAAKVNANAT